MDRSYFLVLLDKYDRGIASDEEVAFLNSYYQLFNGKLNALDQLNAVEKEDLKLQIKHGLQKKMDLYDRPSRPLFSLLKKRLAIAASVLLIAITALLIYRYRSQSKAIQYVSNSKDINPGTSKALLTLSDGSTVILTNAASGIFAMQGNTRITKTDKGEITYNVTGGANPGLADTQTNTISVPKGGQFTVKLADSSIVVLNSGSSIRFPVVFTSNERRVFLKGEAYFEIAHDNKKPFRVVAKNQTVEVLGTHFNINAYDNQIMRTTLVQGSVKVALNDESVLLTPGQQALVTGADTRLKAIDVDAQGAIAWKNGIFHFENADIKEVMQQFARWYDVDVYFTGKTKERSFSGDIHKNMTFSQAVELLGYSNVHFIVNGKKITVLP